jgi:hypothetical protein
MAARKLLSARVNGFVLGGLLLLLGYLWVVDSFRTSFGAYLSLFPFLFLFLSQDMIYDEVHSGCLENLLFIGGRFRNYLLLKNAMTAAAGFGVSLVLFSVFAVYGLVTGRFEISACGRFAAGILAGLYYVAAAGFLSFFFKAGSNVLIILLGQAAIFVVFLLTASQRMGLAGRLTAASFPGWGPKLEFLALSSVLPNIIVGRQTWFFLLGLGAMTLLFLGLEAWRIKVLELRMR